jgi:Fuc2NAc and GlcNAc transferase
MCLGALGWTSWVLLACGFAGSAFLTSKLVHWAPRLGLIDVPNHRSSHITPKPRGGGAGIFIAYMVIVAAYVAGMDLRLSWALPIFMGGGLITLVGLMDDLRGVSAGVRLLAQLVVALVTMLTLSDFGRTDIAVSFLPGAPSWLLYGFCFLFVMWMINLYNFMDGVDGMAATQAVVVATMSAGLCYWQSNWPLFHLYALLGAVAAGFLWFNWAPAKIFMGDSGAYFFGFMFAGLALMSKIYSRESFF